MGLDGSAIQRPCSGLHLERTQDSFSCYQCSLHFPGVFLDSKVVIVKTEVQAFTSKFQKKKKTVSHVYCERNVFAIYLTKKPKKTVGCGCTGIIVLDSNRVQLFPQSLLSCNTVEEKKSRCDRGVSSVQSR